MRKLPAGPRRRRPRRVACVTPVTRVAGRSVTTVEGLDKTRGLERGEIRRHRRSQCGFCPPGNPDACRRAEAQASPVRTDLDRGLAAHTLPVSPVRRRCTRAARAGPKPPRPVGARLRPPAGTRSERGARSRSREFAGRDGASPTTPGATRRAGRGPVPPGSVGAVGRRRESGSGSIEPVVPNRGRAAVAGKGRAGAHTTSIRPSHRLPSARFGGVCGSATGGGNRVPGTDRVVAAEPAVSRRARWRRGAFGGKVSSPVAEGRRALTPVSSVRPRGAGGVRARRAKKSCGSVREAATDRRRVARYDER